MKKIISSYLIFVFMLMTFSGCERIKNSLGLSPANAEIPDNSNKSGSPANAEIPANPTNPKIPDNSNKSESPAKVENPESPKIPESPENSNKAENPPTQQLTQETQISDSSSNEEPVVEKGVFPKNPEIPESESLPEVVKPSKWFWAGLAVATVAACGLWISQMVKERKLRQQYPHGTLIGVETIYPEQIDPALVYQPGANDVEVGDDDIMWFEEEIANNQAIINHYNVVHQHDDVLADIDAGVHHDLEIAVDHYVHDEPFHFIPNYQHDPEGQGQWHHHHFHSFINHNHQVI